MLPVTIIHNSRPDTEFLTGSFCFFASPLFPPGKLNPQPFSLPPLDRHLSRYLDFRPWLLDCGLYAS